MATWPLGMTITWPAVSLAAAIRRRRLVLHAAIGLACQVAGVGVPAVPAQIRQDVGANGNRLGFELLEAPVHPLGTGATEAGPARRGFARHRVRHVLLQRQRVDRPAPARASCTSPSASRGPWDCHPRRTASAGRPRATPRDWSGPWPPRPTDRCTPDRCRPPTSPRSGGTGRRRRRHRALPARRPGRPTRPR